MFSELSIYAGGVKKWWGQIVLYLPTMYTTITDLTGYKVVNQKNLSCKIIEVWTFECNNIRNFDPIVNNWSATPEITLQWLDLA